MIHLDRDSQEDLVILFACKTKRLQNPIQSMGGHDKYKVLKLCKSECLFYSSWATIVGMHSISKRIAIGTWWRTPVICFSLIFKWFGLKTPKTHILIFKFANWQHHSPRPKKKCLQVTTIFFFEGCLITIMIIINQW